MGPPSLVMEYTSLSVVTPSAASGNTILVSAGVATIVCSTVMILTMLFTYTKCVENEHCPALPRLPTISNTWVDPPGNFLSRFVIGNVCFCFGMLQFILWRPERPNFKHASLFMALGIFSVFCLSVVGAICDSASDKECRGNFTIHILCASTFFVLYNMNMILLTSKDGRWKAPSLLLPVLLSTMCKARWLFSHSEALAPPDLTLPAIIEWSDVPYMAARLIVSHLYIQHLCICLYLPLHGYPSHCLSFVYTIPLHGCPSHCLSQIYSAQDLKISHAHSLIPSHSYLVEWCLVTGIFDSALDRAICGDASQSI